MIRLQRCSQCGVAQYPARAFCGVCLSDRLEWTTADALPARVLASTILHHSNEPGWRARLPLRLGLVRFDAGPVAVCLLAQTGKVGDAVQISVGADGLLCGETLTPTLSRNAGEGEDL